MKIEHIQSNINFRAKYLPKTMCDNINILKLLMEKDTIILKGKDFNQVINTRGLSINNGEATFKNGKYLAKRNNKNELVPYGVDTAMLEFGNVRIISNGNGEIIEHKKPLLKSWDSIIEKANKYIQYALDNYKNNDLVIKITNKKETLTENGEKEAQKFMNLFESLNPFGKGAKG